MADATADLLRSLDDPSKFERVAGVPVFQAHERHFPEQRHPDGRVTPARTVRVTEADLYDIARRLNASIAATGHLPPLTEGHRRFDPDYPERLQPKLLGFGKNYRVDWVVRDAGRFLAVLEDEFVKVEHRAALGQYPYRSLEYDADGRIGEGTAFLVRPPFFKMGTTCLYQAEGAMGDEQWTPEDEKAFATFARYMKRYAAMGGANGAMPAPTPAAPPPPPTYQAPPPGVVYVTLGPDGRVAQPTVPPAVPLAPPPAPYQTPAPLAPPPPPAYVPVPAFDPAQYGADLARHAADLAAMRQQLDAERGARVQAECRAMLDPLRSLVTFDYHRELGALAALPDGTARAAHVKYMADNYGRLPGGGFIPVYQGDPNPAAPGTANEAMRPQARRDEIVAYMRARPGCSYEQAEAAVLTGQK